MKFLLENYDWYDRKTFKLMRKLARLEFEYSVPPSPKSVTYYGSGGSRGNFFGNIPEKWVIEQDKSCTEIIRLRKIIKLRRKYRDRVLEFIKSLKGRDLLIIEMLYGRKFTKKEIVLVVGGTTKDIELREKRIIRRLKKVIT